MKHRKFPARPLSESEGFAHIESYLRSGLRPSEYYQRHDISEWQFYVWRKRYLAAHPQESASFESEKQFHPVSLTNAPTGSLSDLEIHYPNGVKVIVGTGYRLEMEQMIQLIKLSL